VYAYPRLGVLLEMHDPESTESMDVVFDVYTLSEAINVDIAQENPRRTEFTDNASWSWLDSISSEERAEKIARWKERHEWDVQVRDELKEHGGFPERLKDKLLLEVLDLKSVLPKIYALSQCTQYITRNPWPHFCQSGVPYCAAAVGRNIAGYYGKWPTEASVAALMGITASAWPTVKGELNYYTSAKGLNKGGTTSFTSETSSGQAHLNDWNRFRIETQKDKNNLVPSSIGLGYGHGQKTPGGWRQPGHWNALYSIKVCKSTQGSESVTFGVFDPYPVPKCNGNQYESFNALKGRIRSHTVPQDKGATYSYPTQPKFEPWKCKLHWYKILYPASCKKIEDLVKRITFTSHQALDEWLQAPNP
jgi:hypothetical protein